jgi:hypothetical protein
VFEPLIESSIYLECSPSHKKMLLFTAVTLSPFMGQFGMEWFFKEA